jgi:hypothetical protein
MHPETADPLPADVSPSPRCSGNCWSPALTTRRSDRCVRTAGQRREPVRRRSSSELRSRGDPVAAREVAQCVQSPARSELGEAGVPRRESAVTHYAQPNRRAEV